VPGGVHRGPERVFGRCTTVEGRPPQSVPPVPYCLPADVTIYVFRARDRRRLFEITTENVVDMMVLTGYTVELGKSVGAGARGDPWTGTVAMLAVPGIPCRAVVEELNDRYGFLQTVLEVRVVQSKGTYAQICAPGTALGGQNHLF